MDIRAFANKLIVNPFFYLGLIALALFLSIFALVTFYATTMTKIGVILALILVAAITSFPDRFRSPISFRLNMVIAIIISAAFGPVIGYLMAAVLTTIVVITGMYYKPIFIVRSYAIGSVIMGVLPAYLGITAQNLPFMAMLVLIILLTVAMPFIVLEGGNIAVVILRQVFNFWLQYMFVKIYGVQILTLLLA